MTYLIGITDLYYKKTKIVTIKAKNKVLAMMEAACTVDKGETLAGELKNLQLGKKGKTHTIKSLKEYLVNYWKISVSTPIEVKNITTQEKQNNANYCPCCDSHTCTCNAC